MDPTTRFSDRVALYQRYRPGYPPEVIALLRRECGLGPGTVVADIGSGTGIFTRLLLETGAAVIAVEPNAEMRHAGEQLLPTQPRLTSSAGRSEATGIAAGTVDLYAAAQAFHWFNQAAARCEMQRILKPGGAIAVLFNERQTTTTPFLVAYEDLLQRFATDYHLVDHRRVDQAQLAAFCAPAAVRTEHFPNQQLFDLDGLTGRLLSSSYAPPFGHPAHAPMVEELARLFARHAVAGRVAIHYTTEVTCCRRDTARVRAPGDGGASA